MTSHHRPTNSLHLTSKPGGASPTDSISSSGPKKNSKGGILITEAEIQAAFNLIDSEKTGTITTTSLKKKLGVFFPDMTSKDYKFLLNNKRELTVDDLYDMLIENDVTNFDPVSEAFKAFDPKGEGKLDIEKLKEAFITYGFGELSESDMNILIAGADMDGDGKINLEDFRSMVDVHHTHDSNPASSSSSSPPPHHSHQHNGGGGGGTGKSNQKKR